VCVCAFLLHRESPDMILRDKPLISEVVLSQWCSWKINHHRMITLKLSVLHINPSNTISYMKPYFGEAPMAWWWSAYQEKRVFNYSETFTTAYVDHIHHGIQSSVKHSDMDFTGQQLRMTWWRSSPSVGTAYFFHKQTTTHANPLPPIDLSCPFATWGIDIVGALPRALRGFRFHLLKSKHSMSLHRQWPMERPA
jgi:hypothetical protein